MQSRRRARGINIHRRCVQIENFSDLLKGACLAWDDDVWIFVSLPATALVAEHLRKLLASRLDHYGLLGGDIHGVH